MIARQAQSRAAWIAARAPPPRSARSRQLFRSIRLDIQNLCARIVRVLSTLIPTLDLTLDRAASTLSTW
jgi:hypothetical protein